eukprot:6254334-Pyramimonas_sp.AAC.1
MSSMRPKRLPRRPRGPQEDLLRACVRACMHTHIRVRRHLRFTTVVHGVLNLRVAFVLSKGSQWGLGQSRR